MKENHCYNCIKLLYKSQSDLHIASCAHLLKCGMFCAAMKRNSALIMLV